MFELQVSLHPTGNAYYFSVKHKKPCSWRCTGRKKACNGSKREGSKRPKPPPPFLLCVHKYWICYQVTRAKMPIPAPRRKKGQSLTGISHLVSSKTPDNSEAGKYMINIKDLK
jgi:hypothetical protein